MQELFIKLFGQPTVDFYKIFMDGGYYQYIYEGIKWTLALTAIALAIGIMIGVCVALIQISRVSNKSTALAKLGNGILKVLKWLASAYVYIIRGTPAVLQIVLMWNVVFATSSLDKLWVGGIAFGINSGAYMAELIRAGIQGIDKGQMEAGRSLGLSYVQTMCYIILPQAFRHMLPAFVSEFIILIKETAVIGFIGGLDLMRASDIIASRTYNQLQPLLIVGACYLILTGVLTVFAKKIEKKINVGR